MEHLLNFWNWYLGLFYDQDPKVNLAAWAATVSTGTFIITFVFKPFRIYIINLFTPKSNKASADSIWKFEVASTNVKLGIHFNITNFRKEFAETGSFIAIKKKFVEEKKSLVLFGRSGLGKTRAVYELLSNSKKNCIILVPFLTRPDTFNYSTSFKKRKKVILFVDDLQKYNNSDIDFYLENLVPNCSELQLIFTCRTEYNESIYYDFQISNLERYSLMEWSENEGRKLAEILNVTYEKRLFDKTPASLIYNLEKLKIQYEQLERHQKTILESIKLLKNLGLECNSDSIKEVAENVFELNGDILKYDFWRTEINKLSMAGFYDIASTSEIVINDIYLSNLISLDFNHIFKRYVKYLKTMKKSGPLFYSGVYLESIKDYTAAQKCYNEAISIYPEYSSAYYRLGSIHLLRADQEENLLDLKPASESIGRAIAYFLSAIKLKPQDASYLITIGYAYTKAASIFDKIREKEKVSYYLNEAVLTFNKAIEINPTNYAAYRMKGFSYFQLKDYENAKNAYETVLKSNINLHHVHYLLGMLYYDWGDESKAFENYRLCIKYRKNSYQAYNNIGFMYAKKLREQDLGPFERIKMAKEATKYYLSSIWYSRGTHYVAYCNLGRLYIDQHEIEKAIKVQTLVINKSPKYSEAYISRAYAYNRMNRHALAESDLMKAIALDPFSESALNNLAYTYQQLAQEKKKSGYVLEAKHLFQKSIQHYDGLLSGTDEKQIVAAKLGKAITLDRMGDPDASFAILTELFSKNTSNSKVLSSILWHLGVTTNDVQIVNFLSILMNLVRQKKIQNIDEELMKHCTLQIQRLSKLKFLSQDLQELVELLKNTYPKNYFVYKTSGVFNLNKGLEADTFSEQMRFFSEAEQDFLRAKNMSPDNPVFLKYIAIVNAQRCVLLKNRFRDTNEAKDFDQYNDLLAVTKSLFENATTNYPEYPEVFVEYSIFLYANNLTIEAQKVEAEVHRLFSIQRYSRKKTAAQIEEELKELEAVKSKAAPDVLSST